MSYKILIVEDDKQLIDLIRFAFEGHDKIDLILAPDEYSAMSLIEGNALDAVITDLQLNSHEGGTLVLQKALEYGLPVAVMTADVSHPDEYYTELGASWLIRKPFDTLDLPQIAIRLASLND